jgi:hypothetical protein
VTETQTADLAAWLTRIWDEEERIAQGVVDRSAPDEATIYLEDPWPEEAAYLPLIKPAAMLAQIAAKRALLALHADSGDGRCGECSDKFCVTPWNGVCEVAAILALPYADRPGYREEWRP